MGPMWQFRVCVVFPLLLMAYAVHLAPEAEVRKLETPINGEIGEQFVNSAGVILLHKETFLNTATHWNIILEIELDPYLDTLALIEDVIASLPSRVDHLLKGRSSSPNLAPEVESQTAPRNQGKLDAALESLQNVFSPSPPPPPFVISKPYLTPSLTDIIVNQSKMEVAILHEQTEHLRKELLQIQKSVTTSPSRSKTNRTRRGLFNIGGEILRFLFGAVTTEELTAVQIKIHKMEQNAHEKDALLKEHIFLTRQVIDHLSDTQDHLRLLQRDVMLLADDLHTLQQWILLRPYFTAINAAINFLQYEVSQLRQALSVTANFKLSSYFLPADKFQEILVDLMSQIPQKAKFLKTPDADSIHQYYAWAMVTPIAREGALRLIIKIPLLAQSQSFDLFQIIPLPTPVPDNDKLFMYVKPNFPYIAVSDDSYQLFSSLSDKYCFGHSSYRVCQAQTATFRQALPSCELALYQNKGEEIKELCDKKITQLTLPLLIRSSNVNEWTYAIPSPLTLAISCLNDSNQHQDHPPITLSKGSGKFSLPWHCQAQNPQIYLPAYFNQQTQLYRGARKLKVPYVKNLLSRLELDSLSQTVWLNKIYPPQQANKLIPLDKLGKSVDFLQSEMDRLQQKHEFESQNDYPKINYFSVIGTILTTCVIVTLGCCAWRQFREKYKNYTVKKHSTPSFLPETPPMPHTSKPPPKTNLHGTDSELSWSTLDANETFQQKVQHSPTPRRSALKQIHDFGLPGGKPVKCPICGAKTHTLDDCPVHDNIVSPKDNELVPLRTKRSTKNVRTRTETEGALVSTDPKVVLKETLI